MTHAAAAAGADGEWGELGAQSRGRGQAGAGRELPGGANEEGRQVLERERRRGGKRGAGGGVFCREERERIERLGRVAIGARACVCVCRVRVGLGERGTWG